MRPVQQVRQSSCGFEVLLDTEMGAPALSREQLEFIVGKKRRSPSVARSFRRPG